MEEKWMTTLMPLQEMHLVQEFKWMCKNHVLFDDDDNDQDDDEKMDIINDNDMHIAPPPISIIQSSPPPTTPIPKKQIKKALTKCSFRIDQIHTCALKAMEIVSRTKYSHYHETEFEFKIPCIYKSFLINHDDISRVISLHACLVTTYRCQMIDNDQPFKRSHAFQHRCTTRDGSWVIAHIRVTKARDTLCKNKKREWNHADTEEVYSHYLTDLVVHKGLCVRKSQQHGDCTLTIPPRIVDEIWDYIMMPPPLSKFPVVSKNAYPEYNVDVNFYLGLKPLKNETPIDVLVKDRSWTMPCGFIPLRKNTRRNEDGSLRNNYATTTKKSSTTQLISRVKSFGQIVADNIQKKFVASIETEKMQCSHLDQFYSLCVTIVSQLIQENSSIFYRERQDLAWKFFLQELMMLVRKPSGPLHPYIFEHVCASRFSPYLFFSPTVI
jgi:ribosomal protein L34